jgi:hypothetical protein
MLAPSRYRRKPCKLCGTYVTTNALGRASHMRHCPGRPLPVKPKYEPTQAEIDAYIERLRQQDIANGIE